MVTYARWLLIVLAALSGLTTDLRIDLRVSPDEDCCAVGDCCCAESGSETGNEPSCCEAEEGDRGPRVVAGCSCGRHGEGAVVLARRTDWLPVTSPSVDASDGRERGYRVAPVEPLRSYRRAPEPPPPRIEA